MWWHLALGVAAALLLVWLVLLATLWIARPEGARVSAAVRILPDVLRLVTRLGRDRSLPRGVRLRLWLLLGYLAMPVDLVPDFIPVIGYADDAVVIVLTLRSVARRAGGDAVTRHWPGSPEGLRVVQQLVGPGWVDEQSA